VLVLHCIPTRTPRKKECLEEEIGLPPINSTMLMPVMTTMRQRRTEMLLNGVEQNNNTIFSPNESPTTKPEYSSLSDKEEIRHRKRQKVKVKTLLNVRSGVTISAVCFFNEPAYSPYPPPP